MLVSGSIGITILKKDKKIVYLLADDHSNTIYCEHIEKNIKNKNHSSIRDYIRNEIKRGNQILLEEIPRGDFELEELWPDSPHTQELKNLFLKDKDIKGIDIRPYLIPFSIETIDNDKKLNDIPISQYLSRFDNFFNLKGKFYYEMLIPTIDKIVLSNDELIKNMKIIRTEYDNIKSFTLKNKGNIKYYMDNHPEIFEKINNLSSQIMEFYTILNIFTEQSKSVIHTGLYHSNNILNLLTNLYNFKIVFKNGVNNFPPKQSKISSCIKLPELKQLLSININ